LNLRQELADLQFALSLSNIFYIKKQLKVTKGHERAWPERPPGNRRLHAMAHVARCLPWGPRSQFGDRNRQMACPQRLTGRQQTKLPRPGEVQWVEIRRRVEAAQSDFPTISNFTHHTSGIPRVKKALLWLDPLEVQQVKPSTGHPH